MLSLVKAQKEDIEAMCRLLEELFTLEADFEPDWRQQRQGLEYIIDHPAYGQILLLKDDSQAVAMVNLLFTVSTALGRRVILLEDFIIKADRRRQGLGRYLMEGVKSFATEHGYARITLLADKDNEAAQSFYLDQGFVRSNMDCWRYFPDV